MTEIQVRTVDLLRTSEVRIQQGATVNVEVPAKGATGHVWTVQADPGQVRILSHQRGPSEKSFGGGGVEVFTLEALTKGHSSVTFQLGAPWKKIPAEEHQLDLNVSAGT